MTADFHCNFQYITLVFEHDKILPFISTIVKFYRNVSKTFQSAVLQKRPFNVGIFPKKARNGVPGLKKKAQAKKKVLHVLILTQFIISESHKRFRSFSENPSPRGPPGGRAPLTVDTFRGPNFSIFYSLKAL